jgi:steroid delta-isomerase-like uncharacterized protein
MATVETAELLVDLAAAWTAHDVEKLLSLCTEDCTYEDVALGVVNRGKAELRAFATGVLAAFPDFKLTVTCALVTGNGAAMEWTMTGTHKGDLPGMPTTNKSFSVRGASMCEIQEGRIKRISDYWDRHGFLTQIGLVKSPDVREIS